VRPGVIEPADFESDTTPSVLPELHRNTRTVTATPHLLRGNRLDYPATRTVSSASLSEK
jgi:hypothetical protein